MAKQAKRTSLLSEADRQKLLKKAGNKKPITQGQSAAEGTSTARTLPRSANSFSTDELTKTPSAHKTKIWLGAAVLLITVFITAPKPQLLEYQSLGLITKSIYMPGWFGKPGVILDTNQRAVLAEDEQSLYLCFEGQSNEQCAKYQLSRQQSFIAATVFWYSSH